ncbi:MAG TPA: hypothetical protein VK588_09395 [Chitinophagaceae bacterium]|nr:hypothetical protein [Chitinophagaceae bacterium]
MPKQGAVLSFTMSGKNYSFDNLYEARQYWACGLHQYETEAMTGDDQFFKINITAVDNLWPGDYVMNKEPTNRVAETCTFWYSGSGIGYTAKHFVVKVISYTDGVLDASFEGGLITKGNIVGEIFNK